MTMIAEPCRVPIRHELKTWPEAFGDLLTRARSFEVRKDDRGYAVGDELYLREWNPKTSKYSGRFMMAIVTYILKGGRWGIEDGYVVMSIRRSPSLERG